MNSWRDRVLREFPPGASRLTVVSDPEGLVLDEAVLAELRHRGFEVLVFGEPVAFRYAYESRCRRYWDDGKPVEVVVVARMDVLDAANLPYDVVQAGRSLTLGLDPLFPGLSRTVVATLDPTQRDALCDAVEGKPPGVLGDNATKDFVLRHVFGIAPELVREAPSLLCTLLRIHHGGQSVPPLLGERLVQIFRKDGRFEDWSLEQIVPDGDTFFAFLQERWPRFLGRAAGSQTPPEEHDHDFAYPGPADLPFDHDDVRVYIDNLFREGFLRPVDHAAADSFADSWVASGVRTSGTDADAQRLEHLLKAATGALPDPDARYGDWLRFARTWAEARALALSPEREAADTTEPNLAALRDRIDAAFAEWLGSRYAGLANLPPSPPVMLHHMPRVLAQHLDDAPEHKAALLVVDGLSMDQWVVVREELARRRPAYRFREGAVFAWIPTITSVSRQAAFAGKPPFYFPPGSIDSTDREPALWRQYWTGRGLAADAAVYQKNLGAGSLEAVADLISRPRVRAAGLVVDTVDKIMHGMELGARGMHGQVRQWAREPYLAALLDLLLDNGFRVWLASDHGNIEATGCGLPAAGGVADLRGKRVHVYPSATLRKRAAAEFPDARPWPAAGLPQDYLPLLAPGRSAFVRKGKRVVAHGGASLEEVVVPLVGIERAEP